MKTKSSHTPDIVVTSAPSASASTAHFETSSLGALRHWLVSGPLLKPYAGPPTHERHMRRNSLDYSTISPPEAAERGAIGTLGLPWKFHDPNRNEYVEFSTFYREPTVLEYHAYTEVSVPETGTWMARFWSAGAADLWVNGEHIDRLNVTRYRKSRLPPCSPAVEAGAEPSLRPSTMSGVARHADSVWSFSGKAAGARNRNAEGGTHCRSLPLDRHRPYETRMGSGVFVPFLACTKYQPPAELPALLHEAVSTIYRQADAQIVVEKTPAYLLTSMAVPAVPQEGEQPDCDLRPGGAGYQQHLWQATLGRGCHIFVNHPGGFFDETSSRPGYWYGNGLVPRLRQQGNWLQAIYVISDGSKTQPEITPEIWEWGTAASLRPYDLHPVAFTHAHWPSDAFDEEKSRPGWRFGRRGRGMIGLWCSEPLVPHDDILTGRELRANGYASAWLAVCGDTDQEGSLEAFAEACLAREPRFDRASFTLHMRGEEPTRWWERSEPMPR